MTNTSLTVANLLLSPDHDWGRHDGGWWWLAGPLTGLVFLTTIGVLVWLVVRASRRPAPGPNDEARRILADRFARGEIDEDEYHDRLSALS